jgi:hypothetical protein
MGDTDRLQAGNSSSLQAGSRLTVQLRYAASAAAHLRTARRLHLCAMLSLRGALLGEESANALMWSDVPFRWIDVDFYGPTELHTSWAVVGPVITMLHICLVHIY